MSIFSSIKDAIFGHPAVQAAAPEPAAPVASQPEAAAPAPAPAPAPQSAPAAAPEQIDPEAALQKIADAKGDPDLNWQTSIVDLMKLIGLDSSLSNRQELATELGYTGEKDGSAEMNEWLHTKVMDKIRTGQ